MINASQRPDAGRLHPHFRNRRQDAPPGGIHIVEQFDRNGFPILIAKVKYV
ncbi:hypothetical protein [Pollutimonas bauzanensis]|uniref:hypothetical protein n=1 Tax=Pollutimonas bauzanensis TaxID=658167 RepID=UPI0015B5588E|nr:hypothetical protein [Pollutimonas bauzanensis]